MSHCENCKGSLKQGEFWLELISHSNIGKGQPVPPIKFCGAKCVSEYCLGFIVMCELEEEQKSKRGDNDDGKNNVH